MKLSLFKDKIEKDNILNTFKNPFEANKCTKINLSIRRSWWTDYKIKYEATVSFENNNTEGTHNIEANSFGELVQKVESFLESLR